MARGTQFLVLRTRLRAKLGRSTTISVGVDDVDRLNEELNSAYAQEYDGHDWPHLRRMFPKKTLSAGQYYYDFPTGLNFERVEKAVIWYNDLPHPCERGIDFEEYAAYDTLSDERSDPALRWDVRDVAGATQFEIWPIPASAQSIQFRGFVKIDRLVNDSDVCLLDDDLVVLRAASKLEKDNARRRELQGEHAERSRVVKAQGARTAPRRQLGLAPRGGIRPNKAVVVVS